MEPLTAIGMGVSLIGNIAGSAGVEAENRRRMEMIARHLATRRLETLNSGINLLSRQKASSIAQAGGDAEMRAIAMGRGNDVEGFVQPQVTKIANAADEGIDKFITNTNDTFNRLTSENDINFASRPIQPNIGHWAGALGSGMAQYGQQQEFLKNLESLYSKYGIQSGDGIVKKSGLGSMGGGSFSDMGGFQGTMLDMPTGEVSFGDSGVSDFTNRFGGMARENN